MSFESDPEVEGSDWTPRPVVFPVFKIPTRLAKTVAWGLLVSAALAIIAGLVTAVSYRHANPPGAVLGGQSLKVSLPSVGFADRVSLFYNEAASLTVALLVVLTVVVIAMAISQDEGRDPLTDRMALLVTTTVVGAIVILANLAQATVILSNANGQFTAQSSANKASSILALLPATVSLVAALVYAVTRIRSSRDHPRQAES